MVRIHKIHLLDFVTLPASKNSLPKFNVQVIMTTVVFYSNQSYCLKATLLSKSDIYCLKTKLFCLLATLFV